jgi:MtN3 and saliva related transmembrane protein
LQFVHLGAASSGCYTANAALEALMAGRNLEHEKLAETESMTTVTWIEVLGTVAGFCTTFAFVPQVVKIWRQGGRDLSYGMLGLYLVGVLLWLVYGLLLHAPAIIIANVATFLLIALAIALKAWKERGDTEKVPISGEASQRS